MLEIISKDKSMYEYAEEMLKIEEELNKIEEFKNEDDIVKELVVLSLFLDKIGG